jgi:hypothetical protein
MAEDFSKDEADESDVSVDAFEVDARSSLKSFFEENSDAVYFSKQLEVINEDHWYHWITNRALLKLVAEGVLRTEMRTLKTNGVIRLLWHKTYRYPRRSAQRVIELVEQYSDPNIGAALGLQGEALILEAFARRQFVMQGREVRSYGGRTWSKSDHDLDFIFTRDGKGYGIEVKNTLRYLDYNEFRTKIEMCRALNIRPVFAVRAMPKSWIYELVRAGGFGLVFRFQLYPWTHKALARKVHQELGLPVDAPRALESGTMTRFVKWHEER